jgi:hypothetical protein
MAGEYNDAIRPTLPGAYTRYIAQRPAAAPPAPGTLVALPITTDWGPMDEATLITDYGHFQAVFGIGGVASDTPGSRAVYDVFRGEGIAGIGGAGGAIVTRFGGSAAAKASVTLNNPAAAPALKIQTRYETSRTGFKVVASPIISNVQTVDFYEGTSLLESYTYTVNVAPALATLRDLVNKTSKVFSIPTDATGVILEGTTGLLAGTFTLTGGNDGATLAAGDWTSVWDAFANDDFAFIAPFNVPWSDTVSEPHTTNRAIIAGLVQWIKDENRRGHRVTGVVGGILDESTATALARAAACASEFVITVGGPGVDDELWGRCPRRSSRRGSRASTPTAARRRRRTSRGSRARSRVPSRAAAPSPRSTPRTLTNGGVVAIMRDRYREAPTRLVKSVNTYTGDTASKPRVIYGNPKFVLSMQQFANEVEADAERNLIGRVVLTIKTRDAARRARCGSRAPASRWRSARARRSRAARRRHGRVRGPRRADHVRPGAGAAVHPGQRPIARREPDMSTAWDHHPGRTLNESLWRISGMSGGSWTFRATCCTRRSRWTPRRRSTASTSDAGATKQRPQAGPDHA